MHFNSIKDSLLDLEKKSKLSWKKMHFEILSSMTWL